MKRKVCIAGMIISILTIVGVSGAADQNIISLSAEVGITSIALLVGLASWIIEAVDEQREDIHKEEWKFPEETE